MPTLNWIGKDKVVSHHQDVAFRVLEHQYGFKDKAEYVDTPRFRTVSLMIKFTEYDTKKIHLEVQDQSGIGSLERAA